MGSYLNHVAAKALGQSVVLQPRVPSLFEPPPALRLARLSPIPSLKAGVETRLDSADSLTTQRDWRYRTWPGTREMRVAFVDDQQSESERPKGDRDHAAVSRIIGHKRREPVGMEPDALTVPETESVSPAPDRISRRKPRITPAPVSRTEQTRPAAIEPATWKDTGGGEPRRKAAPATEPRSEAIRPKELDVDEPEARVSVRHEARSVAAPERAEVAAQSQLPSPKTPTFPLAETKDAEERDGGFSVSVVIGRVNVQAVLPQPVPVRLTHSAPAPLLSLEQYMKQRGGH
jgi:hypothetical protein